MSKSSHRRTGIVFGDLLLILFIYLKLTHAINWSWWWVLSPLWLGLVAIVVIVAGFYAVSGTVALFGGILEARRRNRRIRDAAARLDP